MAIRIHTHRDVWLFTAAVSLIATIAAELCVAGLYVFAGSEAFHLRNAIIMCATMPALIAVPITYFVARMSLSLAETQSELKRLAETDPLTLLPNRRSFFQAAEAVLQTGQPPASLLVIDADHFKELNDSYGHAVGDQALIVIADILRNNFRSDDLICRVGGEEFAVLLPGMDVQQAETLAQRVVTKVAANPISEPGAIIEFSVSCGLADTSTSMDLQVLFKAADDAMYLAKKQGRNRVARLPRAA